jgi:hypothetical protein
VITVVSLVAFSSIAYSAWADINGVIGTVGQGPRSPAVAAETVTRGNSITLYLNVTVSNKGLYPLTIGLTCQPSSTTKLMCQQASVIIPPAGQSTLHFSMTVLNASQPSIQANGTLSVTLQPFASVYVGVNLGSMLNQGG